MRPWVLLYIQNHYLDYLHKQKTIPVLIIDVSKVDFLEHEDSYNQIMSALENNYEKTVTYLDFNDSSNLKEGLD